MVKNKRAAIEMSIGTIVTLVLSITLLIILISVITRIGDTAKNTIDLTDSQLTDKMNKLFNSEKKLALYPDTGEVTFERGDMSEFSFGVQNLLSGSSSANAEFSYEVKVSDAGTCGITLDELQDLIILGGSGTMSIPAGEISSERVRFEIPDGFPNCVFRTVIEVKANGNNYASDKMDIIVG